MMVFRVLMQRSVVGLFQASVSEPNSFTLKREAARSSETSGQSHYTIWCETQKAVIWMSMGELRCKC